MRAAVDFSVDPRQRVGMRRALLLAVIGLTGCGEAVQDDHFANDMKAERPTPAAAQTDAVPVRIGELGPNFDACGAVGTTRNLAEGASLPVRSAPFDSAGQKGEVAAGTRFFVCSRSHDQRWLGVVYEPGGELSTGCGVSSPVASRRNYDGPCRSGWVSSVLVKLVAG
jgi:hypothetical protein